MLEKDAGSDSRVSRVTRTDISEKALQSSSAVILLMCLSYKVFYPFLHSD